MSAHRRRRLHLQSPILDRTMCLRAIVSRSTRDPYNEVMDANVRASYADVVSEAPYRIVCQHCSAAAGISTTQIVKDFYSYRRTI